MNSFPSPKGVGMQQSELLAKFLLYDTGNASVIEKYSAYKCREHI